MSNYIFLPTKFDSDSVICWLMLDSMCLCVWQMNHHLEFQNELMNNGVYNKNDANLNLMRYIRSSLLDWKQEKEILLKIFWMVVLFQYKHFNLTFQLWRSIYWKSFSTQSYFQIQVIRWYMLGRLNWEREENIHQIRSFILGKRRAT